MTRPARYSTGLIVALAAVLLLSGCGRKGPLDPPPGSGSYQGGQPAPGGPGASPTRGMPQDFDENGKPIAPPGQKTRQYFDWLLD